MVNPAIPQFLASETEFVSHIQSLMSGLPSDQIGERFARFAQHLFPHSNIGKGYPLLTKRQVSHDGGVDLEAKALDGNSSVYVQVKYTIRGVDELDSIFSKFSAFEANRGVSTSPQTTLFPESTDSPLPESIYVIFTSSSVDGLLEKYERSGRPSTAFYTSIKRDGRFTLLDRHNIYEVLLNTY